ncbi:MAG: hypothetical protein HY681_05945 [Chloroflexi bacterium]|nr:hypothetical protein [Chloroflexota bacterium]
MSKEQVTSLLEAMLLLERETTRAVGDVHDPLLDTRLADGRSVRQAIHELAAHYREHIEQLLWTKWGQAIPRSETKRILAELQAARAQFGAYFSDLQDGQLDAKSASANGASPRDTALHVLEDDNKTLDMIVKALHGKAG